MKAATVRRIIALTLATQMTCIGMPLPLLADGPGVDPTQNQTGVEGYSMTDTEAAEAAVTEVQLLNGMNALIGTLGANEAGEGQQVMPGPVPPPPRGPLGTFLDMLGTLDPRPRAKLPISRIGLTGTLRVLCKVSGTLVSCGIFSTGSDAS